MQRIFVYYATLRNDHFTRIMISVKGVETLAERKAKWQNDYISRTYDRINLTVDKGRKDIIRAHAESRGESVNAFINRARAETMERDNQSNSRRRAWAGCNNPLRGRGCACVARYRAGVGKIKDPPGKTGGARIYSIYIYPTHVSELFYKTGVPGKSGGGVLYNGL